MRKRKIPAKAASIASGPQLRIPNKETVVGTDGDPNSDSDDEDAENKKVKGSKDNKSSGLKRIAKQVIDIIQTRPFMSYPQVAFFVVQLNLTADAESS